MANLKSIKNFEGVKLSSNEMGKIVGGTENYSRYIECTGDGCDELHVIYQDGKEIHRAELSDC